MDVKLIPGTKGFSASVTGVIYDPNGLKRSTYTNKDGYETASVLLGNGKWQTFGVHRLVALAHIPLEGDPKDFTVNHRDGRIRHNVAGNLEWVSSGDNNVHAALLRGSKHRPVILVEGPDGTLEFISNLQTAAKKFHCDQSLIWDAIREDCRLFGYRIWYHSTKSLVPEELSLRGKFLKEKAGIVSERPIKVLDLRSNKVQYFNSIWEAGKFFNTSSSHVFQCISNLERKKLFKKQYLITDVDVEFPTLSQEEFEILSSSNGKEVLAYNVRDNRFVVYRSASQFIKENGLSKKAVTVDLKKKRLRLIRDWWFTYFDEESVDRLKSVLAVQGKVATE